MDENTNKKIEELKKNPPNRVLPVLLIPVAVVALFCYRVATTDPQWEASAPQPAAAPAKPAAAKPVPKTAPAPSSNQAPAAKPAKSSSAPAAPAAAVDDDQPTTANPPAAAADTAETKSDEAEKSDEQTTETASEPNNSSALDTYLAGHLGQRVPFLYKGEKRTVTIAAFTDETVTIKRKKTFTMKRSELSPEQLALWK